MRKPRVIVEDVLVRVEKLIIPVHFVILDVDDNVEAPLILECPFLNTSVALIDVESGKMTLRVGEEEAVFTLSEAMKHTLDHDDTLYFTNETDLIISDCVQEVLAVNLLDDYLEELDSNGNHKEVFTSPPAQQVNYVAKNLTPSGKKKKKIEESVAQGE